ncbi:MAG: K(+)-stimulated pyrophosphate-energized sodium pump, partial [Methylophagaceae bacterium]
MSSLHSISPLLGIFGLFCAYVVYTKVKAAPTGSGKVVDIGDQIHLGAMVFMKAEYSRLAIFCLICIAALWASDLGWPTALAFFIGAICSAAAGYIGMYAATQANVRTATAAQDHGAPRAL